MFAYYIERGHSLKELMNLSELEKLFYFANMEASIESQKETFDEFYYE